ncbi:enoyl-CoA hydratase/isomerase family protein [Halorientalis salina]|uniref:enoyl-CoA hydratase/isomerase family protein n=1 Tax=Halorientalis salina TaxID=2932266 RepID=UPI0010AD5CA3|nr:enoyl-CoA hydratase-related protein [Halorientalis salina]
MSDDAVLVSVDDQIATVTLNNPDMRNALTAEVSAGIVDALDEIERSDARVVVVEGAGSAFCAGGDINSMMEGLSGDIPAWRKAEEIMASLHRAIERLIRCPLPTVAKIDGQAFGAGASLAIACDVQAVHEDVDMSFAFRKVGLAVDSGTSWMLPRLVGANVAKRLVLTGQVITAEEAQELGVVTDVYDDEEYEERTAELVAAIAEGPTVGLKISKRLIRQNATKSLTEALDDEATAQALALGSQDHAEGASAFMEGRDTEFEGR